MGITQHSRMAVAVLSAVGISTATIEAQVSAIVSDMGTNTIEYVFEDTELSDGAKNLIRQDILHVRSGWNSSSIEYSDEGNTVGVIDDEGVLWTPWGHEQYGKLRKFSTVSNSVLRCTVPKELSDSYCAKFASIANASNVFAEAVAFSAFLQEGDYSRITPDNVTDFFYSSALSGNDYRNYCADIVQAMSNLSYSQVSVLSFGDKDAGFCGFPSSAYWVDIPCGHPRNGVDKEYSHVYAVWFDSKWHLVLEHP